MLRETTKSYLEKLIIQAGKELGFNLSGATITAPDVKFGDYSTNVALVLAKKEKKSPKEVAVQIIKKIKEIDSGSPSPRIKSGVVESGMTVSEDKEIDSERKSGMIHLRRGFGGQAGGVFEKIEEVKGFINFLLSQKFLTSQLSQILESKEKYGSSNIGEGEKVLVEYFQPNITKPLHLGHLRTAMIGDSIFRILSFLGYSAESDTHLGDWGTQFGILLYGYKEYGDPKVIEKDPIAELNKLYVKVNSEIEKNLELKEKGKAEFVKLEKGDKENRELWKKFVEWSWKEFEVIYEDFGIRKHDHNWSESFFEDKMPSVIEELKKKGLLKESEGAQIVDLEEFNLGVAIIIKSDGGTTYLLRDLATFIYRKQQGFARQLYVVDVRQNHTLAQTFKILELLGQILNPAEAIHISYGFLALPEGAMSSRKGTMVTANALIKEAEAQALSIIKEKNPELKNKEKVARQVAAGAVKYFDLSHNIKSDIVFEMKKAISFEGDTGPYLQYTHARIFGILRKANFQFSIFNFQSISNYKMFNEQELLVMRKLHQFPEIVERAAIELQPNIVCNYLFELSQSFNNFYQNVPVIREADDALRAFRLNLIVATAQVIKNGLSLLGIEAPEEM